MKNIIIISLILIAFVLSSCGLERSNPLDPKGNPKIRVPQEVVNLSLRVNRQQGVPQFIEVTWDRIAASPEDAPQMGYYVYRSFSRHSRFERVHTEHNISIAQWQDRENITSGREYWYRISAFVDYPEGRLEGKLSPLIESSAIWVN